VRYFHDGLAAGTGTIRALVAVDTAHRPGDNGIAILKFQGCATGNTDNLPANGPVIE